MITGLPRNVGLLGEYERNVCLIIIGVPEFVSTRVREHIFYPFFIRYLLFSLKFYSMWSTF